VIGAFVSGIMIGVIVGWAISAWHHALTDAPAEQHTPHWTSVGGRSGVYQIDAYYARMLKPILEKMGWQVKL
jgi:hypothetical protein